MRRTGMKRSKRKPLSPEERDRRLKITKVCANPDCDGEFRPWNTMQRYCGAKCAKTSEAVRAALTAPRPDRRRRMERTCQTCGKTFEVHQWNVNRKWCTRECWRNRTVAPDTRRKQRDAARDRRGTKNPNYRHGEDKGRHDREGLRRFDSGQRTCQHPRCEGKELGLNQHHVVYDQHVRDKGGDRWDPRNALCLCHGCHASHHRRGTRVVPVSALRPENVEFAYDLLGPAAQDYFARYYQTEEQLT